jgi:hypothetical protein
MVRAANPSLTAAQVRIALQTTAFHLGSPQRNSYYGYGLVDAVAAVEHALLRRPWRPLLHPDPMYQLRTTPPALRSFP